MKGTVVRLEEFGRTATLRHDTVREPDGSVLMEPMTMRYAVPEREAFQALRKGEQIHATVYQLGSDGALVLREIQEITKAK